MTDDEYELYRVTRRLREDLEELQREVELLKTKNTQQHGSLGPKDLDYLEAFYKGKQ